MPRAAHDHHMAGALYIIALHPGGASGYQPQSYGPFSASYAEIAGLTRNARSRFSVSCICGASLSHSWSGKSLSVVANVEMNASLNIWMVHSAAFTRWLFGSTN